ncbi:MAG: ATP-dependent DNA helicase RecG [Firmicutes bacterium]|nr:ATP-dependent DNA helicase RecG [Bacillota bacterium]
MKIDKLSGVGAKRAHSLYTAGIYTVADLLNHFPRDYDDRSQVKTVAELSLDAVNTIRGTVAADPETATLPRKGAVALNITKVIIQDHTGTLELVWFNQPYLKKYFIKHGEYIFTGKVRALYGGRVQMQSPEYELCNENELSHGRIVPVYTTPKQFSQKTFRALIHQALGQSARFSSQLNHAFAEHLPYSIRKKYNLCGRETAIHNIHFPESDELFLAARRRLVFEELFFMQMALLQMKDATTAQTGITLADTDLQPFLRGLPFSLTNAQAKVLAEIAGDMSGGRRMNRLVQGDVGSGKTAVAMAAAYVAMKNGYQAALMAPTDVLANQHFLQCQQYFALLGFETVLLTGSIGAKARREALAKIQDGRAAMIVGTHALIQEKVEYARLGLAITDEQHRFGVNQRLSLTQKAAHPHTLVMTATPIPRTLGMILYGDLDISIINELPPGRQVIKTYSVNSKYQQRIHEFIRKEVEQGRQAYIICPAIEASQTEDSETTKAEMKNVMDYTAEISAALPNIKIAYLHGKMKPADKQQIMDDFKAGHINALVSTTVIEVGVHVANATLMIIENAERFGLSQLHQLRGRVGRGKDQSYCVLITDTNNDETKARMKAMCDTTDGFKLAELDLELRGAGDFFGTRQHGLPVFMIANLYRDIDVLKEAQEAVTGISGLDICENELNIIKMRIGQVLGNTHGGVM